MKERQRVPCLLKVSFQVGEIDQSHHFRVARRLSHARKVDIRRRLTPGRIVSTIVEQNVNQIRRLLMTDRRQRSEVHQQCAIPIDGDDSLLRLSLRQSQSELATHPIEPTM